MPLQYITRGKNEILKYFAGHVTCNDTHTLSYTLHYFCILSKGCKADLNIPSRYREFEGTNR